jgi:Tetratricopeptide repeat
MPLADDLVALAALAGNTVVAAAATDAWESTRDWIRRLFSRDADQAEEQLAETRSQLRTVTGKELEQTRAVLAQRWSDQLAGLLEDNPDVEADLRSLVGRIQSRLVSADNHGIAVGQDVNVSVGGGVAVGTAHASAIAATGGTAIGRVEYQRPQAARLPMSLAPRPVYLTGREDLMAELGSRASAGNGTSPQIVTLCGLGGAGKTSIAVEYAHRHVTRMGLVWQFPAEDPAVLLAEFGRLADLLGAQDPFAPADPVALVHAMLAAYDAPWLLVFDNAPDRKTVQRFLPPTGNGRILVTSQSALWPPDQVLNVPMLDAKTAAEFLTARTGDPDIEAAIELGGDLDGLPLALEQVGAYVQATGESLSEYRRLFRQRMAELLARGEPIGYDGTVHTTWTLAFSRLDPGAAGLLRLLACCAPEEIPLRLLMRPSVGLTEKLGQDVAPVLLPLIDDSLVLGDAVTALRRYSLIAPVGEGLVQIHRLVQAVTINQMPAGLEAQWRQASAALIEAALPDDASLPDTWPVCAVLLSHARVVLTEDSVGMGKIAEYIGSYGSPIAGRELQSTVAAARKRNLGPEHPDTLAAYGELAFWTGVAGNPAGARDQYAALLPVIERVTGAEHKSTLSARSSLARWTGEAGNPEAARDQFASLLHILERIHDPDDPSLLVNRARLAGCTGEAGDPVAARDQYAALLPAIERVCGAEHPSTLAARGNLAGWTGAAGDPASARDQFAALVRDDERVYGTEHPSSLVSRGNLAHYTGEAGNPGAARNLYAALLPVIEEVCGPEHPYTLNDRVSLANWTGAAGDPTGARDQLIELLPVIERVYGLEHPDTLAARRNLADWTQIS